MDLEGLSAQKNVQWCTDFCAYGGQRSGAGCQRSPVKFAALVFFEEFNGASRCQGVISLGVKMRYPHRCQNGSSVGFAFPLAKA